MEKTKSVLLRPLTICISNFGHCPKDLDYTYNFNDATNFARPNNARPTDIAKRRAAKAKLAALTPTKSRTRGPTILNPKEVAEEMSRDTDKDDLVGGAS